MWRELDLGEVRAELAHMRDLGFRVVRFFLLTEDFMPAPMTVVSTGMNRLPSVPVKSALVNLMRTGRSRWATINGPK